MPHVETALFLEIEGRKRLVLASELPLVTGLRAPPVVGEWYQVWCIRQTHQTSHWPVHVPGHECNPGAGFHYHHDVRFFTEGQEAELAAKWLGRDGKNEFSPFFCQSSVLPPGIKHGLSYQNGAADGKEWAEPVLMPRQCRYSLPTWDVPNRDVKRSFAAKTLAFDVCGREAVRTKSGRLLCPHQNFDVTSWVEPGADHVTCPMHGLRLAIPGSPAVREPRRRPRNAGKSMGKKKGPQSRIAAHHADRIAIVADERALRAARLRGDLEAEQTIQDRLDLSKQIEAYQRTGLSLDQARTAAQRDMAALAAARAVSSEGPSERV